MSIPDRAAAFLDDILAKPASLARLLDAYTGAGSPLEAIPRRAANATRIVFVGLGSSRYAALDTATALRARGLAAWTEFAGADPATPPAPDVVVVAISASGRTPEVIEVIERHRGTSVVLAVTNQPEAPVGELADAVLPLLAGDETAGIACRTYAATDAVLALLGDRLTGNSRDAGRLGSAVDAIGELLNGRGAWLDGAVDELDRAPRIDVVAPARHLGLAEQAALMLREAPRLDAHAHETVDWLHTAIYTALPGHRALLIPGSPRDEDVVRTVHQRGGTTIQLGPGTSSTGAIPIPPPDLPDAGWPLVVSTVAELLAETLWQRSDGSLKVP